MYSVKIYLQLEARFSASRHKENMTCTCRPGSPCVPPKRKNATQFNLRFKQHQKSLTSISSSHHAQPRTMIPPQLHNSFVSGACSRFHGSDPSGRAQAQVCTNKRPRIAMRMSLNSSPKHRALNGSIEASE